MKITISQHIQVPFYTEGPAMDGNGRLFCTTLSGGSILLLNQDNQLQTWATSSCPNGQYITTNNEHLVCDSKLARIVRYDSEGKFLKIEMNGHCGNEKVFVPNDLVVDGQGGIYFTDSVRENGKVCYLSQEGVERIVCAGLDYPNGLCLSRDNELLYIAESYRNRILVFRLREDGIADGDPKVFAALPLHPSCKEEKNLPDGIALDNKSRLWVAHYGMSALQVLSSNGVLLETIPIPFPLVSNVFLPGDDASMLIVTGGSGEPGPGAFLKLLCTE